jgi:adenylosuccinate synthase
VPITMIVGAQWGDEGKGKIVDLLAEESDIVARCAGGPNAGHTVVIAGQTFVVHLLPTGALRPDKVLALGSGVVIDLAALFGEIAELEGRGLSVESRLRIDPRAHVILPYHRILERVDEAREKGGRIGTTGRGIGPAYAMKAARSGMRVLDLLIPDRMRERVTAIAALVRSQVGAEAWAEGGPELSPEKVIAHIQAFTSRVTPLVADVSTLLTEALAAGKRVLVEGAQGTLLDIDHGTYPYVTSSSTIAGGALTGLGLGPQAIGRVIGVAKAYTTRVGRGPFPTELEPEAAATLRDLGAEFGATTGRPRRCGWLDLVGLRRAARISGFEALAVTKLDVLDQMPVIPICVRYAADPRGAWWPEAELADARPVYRELKGWQTSTRSARRLSDLPPAAREYLAVIAEETGIPVVLASVGSGREETVRCGGPAIDGRGGIPGESDRAVSSAGRAPAF